MAVVTGVWFAVVGGLAALAGLSGMHRVRRLRRTGVATWAMIVAPPPAMGQQDDVSPRQALLQYTLADGRQVERVTSGLRRKSASLRPGQKVLVWYDPADPDDVLVYGRWGRSADRVFVAVGALFIVIGAGLVTLGP
jgi:Protein of unknown function (DUF3592)